jgi:phosphoglycerate kinase
MSQKLSVTDLDVRKKKVLIRVDFNVPLDKNGRITDDTRIVASLPTIKYVLDHGGSVILMSHLGRPKGKKNSEFSLKPCAKRLEEILGIPVKMAPDCIGSKVEEMVANLKTGEIILLENLRFYSAEESPEKDSSFAKKLSELGDLYVNDAFGTAHRAHSSTVGIAKYFSKAAAGFLLLKELQFLGLNLLEPKRPFFSIIGGAKISSKLGVIKSLIDKVDALFIGGGMAYTFLKAKGIEIGNSLLEKDLVEEAKYILEKAKNTNVALYLPFDSIIVEKLDNNAPFKIVDTDQGIPNGYQGVDIGPKTIEFYRSQLKKACTVLWNGPLGIFEMSNFAKGTNAIALALSQLNATTIVGGGDSIAAIQMAGVTNKITHISTGGGASLEFIELGTLPGIEVLSNKQ